MPDPEVTNTTHPSLSRRRLWLGAASGPASWGALLLLMYFSFSVLQSESSGATRAVLLALCGLAIIAIGLGFASLLSARRVLSHRDRAVARTDSRHSFMATTGSVAAILFLFGVALLALPVFILDVQP